MIAAHDAVEQELLRFETGECGPLPMLHATATMTSYQWVIRQFANCLEEAVRVAREFQRQETTARLAENGVLPVWEEWRPQLVGLVEPIAVDLGPPTRPVAGPTGAQDQTQEGVCAEALRIWRGVNSGMDGPWQMEGWSDSGQKD